MSSPVPCAIAIMAKAPVPHYCKTRLIPYLGAPGAARLQQRLLRKTLACARDAELGPVTLFCTPGTGHGLFSRLRAEYGVGLRPQSGADLGQRMLAAIRSMQTRCRNVMVLGTDCPALTPDHLRRAAALLENADHVIQPAEDGGYVLLATRRYEPLLFRSVHWGSPQVMHQTRRRLARLQQPWKELPALWDLDEWPDYRRALRSGIMEAVHRRSSA